MATPRVFVSSTYYDLKYIRENIKYFIRTLGYEPTLSEEGDVFYNPQKHTHDSCISEVSSCQMFILIIGGRFGGTYKSSEKSITNTEYLKAIECKIPVFALVEAPVYAEHNVYNENLKKNGRDKAALISYPSVDNVKIFEFIDEVRKNVINNAIVPFRDFSDIEIYLKKQWAGLMFSFLSASNEESRVSNTLSELTKMSEKIEFLSKQILSTIGTAKDKLTIRLYDAMIKYECFRDLTFCKIRATPVEILKAKDFEDVGKNYNVILRTYQNEKELGGLVISPDGQMSLKQFTRNKDDFKLMKEELIKIIQENGLSLEDYLKE